MVLVWEKGHVYRKIGWATSIWGKYITSLSWQLTFDVFIFLIGQRSRAANCNCTSKTRGQCCRCSWFLTAWVNARSVTKAESIVRSQAPDNLSQYLCYTHNPFQFLIGMGLGNPWVEIGLPIPISWVWVMDYPWVPALKFSMIRGFSKNIKMKYAVLLYTSLELTIYLLNRSYR